ncbi:PEP-CTERM sorting domain-containing protein [Pacificimonas sp. ICDLI1SI03]
MKISAVACVAAVLLSTSAMAEPVFDRFGALPQTEFGGDGIPNDRVAVTNISSEGVDGEIGITATPRFSAPSPTLVSDGVFAVESGTTSDDRSKWNFSYYADVLPGLNYSLLYDFDPSNGTDYGTINFLFASGTIEDSQNPTFAFLNDGIAPFVIAPEMFDFDADASGIYNFRFQARDANGGLVGEAAIDVIVGEGATDVPAPAAFGLLGLGLAGLGFARRRKA